MAARAKHVPEEAIQLTSVSSIVQSETMIAEMNDVSLGEVLGGRFRVLRSPVSELLSNLKSSLKDFVHEAGTNHKSQLGIRAVPASGMPVHTLIEECEGTLQRCDYILEREMISDPSELQVRNFTNVVQLKVSHFLLSLNGLSSDGVLPRGEVEPVARLAINLRYELGMIAMGANASQLGVDFELV